MVIPGKKEISKISPEKGVQPVILERPSEMLSETKVEEIKERAKFEQPKIHITAVQAPVIGADEEAQTKKIVEEILSENMVEIYEGLPLNLQEEFKKQGDETATQISKLLQQAKDVTRQILDLIKKWLKIIPGLNKFFIEQEAKTKTAKLMALASKRKSGI